MTFKLRPESSVRGPGQSGGGGGGGPRPGNCMFEPPRQPRGLESEWRRGADLSDLGQLSERSHIMQ